MAGCIYVEIVYVSNFPTWWNLHMYAKKPSYHQAIPTKIQLDSQTIQKPFCHLASSLSLSLSLSALNLRGLLPVSRLLPPTHLGCGSLGAYKVLVKTWNVDDAGSALCHINTNLHRCFFGASGSLFHASPSHHLRHLPILYRMINNESKVQPVEEIEKWPSKIQWSQQGSRITVSQKMTGHDRSTGVRWSEVTSGSAESMTKWSVRYTFRIHLNRIRFRFTPATR